MNDLMTQLELAVGTGEDRFTMTRGSFSYKQILGKPVRLSREHIARTADGVAIAFAGSSPEERYTLLVTEEPGGPYPCGITRKECRRIFAAVGTKAVKILISTRKTEEEINVFIS